MTELIITIVAITGFVAFIVAVARLGRGEVFDIGGLFGQPGVIGRAHGVQEQDLPPFRFGASATGGISRGRAVTAAQAPSAAAA